MIPKTTLAGLLASMRSGENDPLRNWRPSVVATTGQTATVNMTTADGSAYTVDWGDGTSSTVASAANATRVYAGNYSGGFHLSPLLERSVRNGQYSVAVNALRRSMKFEFLMAILIICLVAWLGTLSPEMEMSAE